MAKEYSFIQKVGWLFSGLFIVQVIHLIFSLILPRIYQPEQFAVFGIYLSTIFILFEINTFRLDHALMLPKEDEESLFIFRKAFLYSTYISIALGAFWLLYTISPFYKEEYHALKWLPLSVFLQGFIQPAIAYSNKVQNYQWINISRIFQALITGIVSCAPLFFNTQKVYLIEGFVSGQLVSFIVFNLLYFNKLISITKSNTLSLKPYLAFPKYGTLSSFLNTLSRNSIVYILSLFFTPQAVGLYTFTNRLVQAPIGLVTSAVGQAYFRDASQASNSKELRNLTHTIQKILTQIAIIPVLAAMIWGPAIFELLFGADWRSAGEIARYLALWYGTTLVITPLSMLIDVKSKLKWELSYNIVFSACRIGVLILAGIFLSFTATIILFCAVSVFFNLYLLVYLKQLIEHES